jgi:probable HAF family extracellular repeat protein
VLTALTTATAAASPPTPMGVQADARPRSLTPGFLLDHGRYTTLEVPGATVETGAGGINNRGQIVGGARGGGSPDRGFLRDGRGRYRTFRFPGARSTLAQKLNDRGQITGLYSNTTDDPRAGADLTGFLLDRGRYTRIAVPGARTTTAVGINNRGQVVGQYQDANGRYHGYVWERGRFRTIDTPGAVGTSLTDINDRGQIVGARVEPDGTFRGFVLDQGRFSSFAAPGAVITIPGDLNNRGQIVGSTIDPATETARGFLLAKGANGPFTPVSVPGAPSTFVFGLNDRGQITGAYNNPNAATSPAPATTPSMGQMA